MQGYVMKFQGKSLAVVNSAQTKLIFMNEYP